MGGIATSIASRPTTGRLARSRRRAQPFLLVAPAIVVLVVLIAYPLLSGAINSLTDLRLARWNSATWIGLDNYTYLLTHAVFWDALRVTVVFTVMAIAVELPLGIFLALALNQPIRGIQAFRAVALIPIMVPNVVAALMWRSMMAPQGVLSSLLAPLGLSDYPWLGDPTTVLFALLVIDVWMMTPFVIIVVLAALQTVPQDLYEAGKVDGGSPFELFQRITSPLILPLVLVAMTIRLVELIQVFDVVFVTTVGGPTNASKVLQMAAYKEGFQDGFLGSGMAFANLLALIVMGILFVFGRRYVRAQAITGDA
jgi:multiple sugar transport system permease protein